ncbi:MAG: alcohol dehydrogenase catalytic domain-containing protein [Salinisphaera sp.]|nr:alcohol dehydrogenase catalytic domain-containing protein [Salinisphaera sp.]
MLAAFIHGIRHVQVAHKNDPLHAPEKVLIRVGGVDVRDSDRHYYLEGGIDSVIIREPFVPGSEFAGWVAGDHPTLDLTRNQLVGVDRAQPCADCEWCRCDHVDLCPQVIFLGASPQDGVMTATVAVRAEQIFPVRESFDVARAVMLEPLGVAIQAPDLIRPQLGDTIIVLGCGLDQASLALELQSTCADAAIKRLILPKGDALPAH